MTCTKIASVGMAGMLALSLSLAACGNGESTSTASTTSTSTEESASSVTSETSTKDTTSASSTTDTTDTVPAFEHEGYWSGKNSDGAAVYYNEDPGNRIWEVVVVPSDPSSVEGAILVNGIATKTDDGISITDINTGDVADITFISASDTEITVKVGNVEATLTPCSLDDFLSGEDAVFAIKASAE